MTKLLLTLVTLLLFQSVIFAEDSLDVDPLANIKVSKDDILKSMESLKKQGKISEADFQNAKKELMGMSDTQVNNITDTAVEVIRKDPDKAVGLLNGPKIDANEVKKQAEAAKTTTLAPAITAEQTKEIQAATLKTAEEHKTIDSADFGN